MHFRPIPKFGKKCNRNLYYILLHSISDVSFSLSLTLRPSLSLYLFAFCPIYINKCIYKNILKFIYTTKFTARLKLQFLLQLYNSCLLLINFLCAFTVRMSDGIALATARRPGLSSKHTIVFHFLTLNKLLNTRKFLHSQWQHSKSIFVYVRWTPTYTRLEAYLL